MTTVPVELAPNKIAFADCILTLVPLINILVVLTVKSLFIVTVLLNDTAPEKLVSVAATVRVFAVTTVELPLILTVFDSRPIVPDVMDTVEVLK